MPAPSFGRHDVASEFGRQHRPAALVTKPSTNFAYLAYHDARLVALATQAEEHFATDPAVTLVKLRLFGEVLAQRAAAKVGPFVDREENQQRLIDRLFERNVTGATQRTLFRDLRRGKVSKLDERVGTEDGADDPTHPKAAEGAGRRCAACAVPRGHVPAGHAAGQLRGAVAHECEAQG